MANRATRIAGVQYVVGGQYTGVNEYPWMVKLQLSKWGRTPSQCGGSIISNRHILTAAHCTAGKTVSNIKVILGEHDTTDSVGAIRTISAITEHPNYALNNDNGQIVNAYDVSILTLSSPITFSRTISPVCLPSYDGKLFEGKLATITGWGRTSWGGPNTAKLMEVDVTVTSNHACNRAYGGRIKE